MVNHPAITWADMLHISYGCMGMDKKIHKPLVILTVTRDRHVRPLRDLNPQSHTSEWPQTHALDHAATGIGLPGIC